MRRVAFYAFGKHSDARCRWPYYADAFPTLAAHVVDNVNAMGLARAGFTANASDLPYRDDSGVANPSWEPGGGGAHPCPTARRSEITRRA